MLHPITRLIAGFKSFRAEYYEQRPERIRHLAEYGQKPAVLVIACSDSRIDPALVTRAEPGELFVVRNVASLVPPYQPDGTYHGTSAAIEFAVRDLQVTDVVVMGHSGCGGVRALAQAMAGELCGREFITPWVLIAKEKCAGLPAPATEADFASYERAVIRGSLDNLLTFPWVREAVEQGRLTLHGWLFELSQGELWGCDTATRDFRPLA